MKNTKLVPSKIYYWQEGDNIFGAMRVKMKRLDEVFGGGFSIEDSELLKFEMTKKGKDVDSINFYPFNRKKAISQVKIVLVNVYNALLVHGKSILDKNKDIDIELFKKKEREILLDDGEVIDTNLTHPFKPLKEFKASEITLEEAKDLDLL